MAGKFVEMKEAAELLGMSPDELSELRGNGEIHGYRDGASWKFKQEEVQRFADERGIELGSGGDGVAEKAAAAPDRNASSDDELEELISLSDDEDDSDDSASILVSEQSLGHSGESASSTVIGKEEEPKTEHDSDLELARAQEEEDPKLASEELAPEEDELQLVPDQQEESSDDLVDSGDELGLADLDEPGAKKDAVSRQADQEADEDALSSEDDDDFALSDDEDLVLATDEPRGSGSDVTLGSGDSGINLATPSDSGLSLEEEPLDLGGSGAGSLELPSEDEDLLSMEDEAESDEAVELKQDEEFQLGPTDEMVVDESDSGSQVIALEESEDFEEGVAVAEADEEPLLEADEDLGDFDHGPAVTTSGLAGMAPMRAGELPEAEYSLWNMLGLLLIVLVLCLGGMIMVDVVRNMWSYNEGFSATTSISDSLSEFLFE